MALIKVKDPRTGKVERELQAAGPDEIADLADQLKQAQPNWAADIGLRIDALTRWRDAMHDARDEMAIAVTQDTGRRAVSYLETDGMARRIEYWVERTPGLLQVQAETPSSCADNVNYTLDRVPYPLVGIISPWNFPLTLSLVDAIPALCAGCAVLLKPSEVTPRFADVLRNTVEMVPELAQVFSVVIGDGAAGQALVDQVDMVCFTGSVATGRKVAVQAAGNFIPACLELGGKDPAIVLESADIDVAADAILRSAVGSSGQACMSLERIYAHRAVFDSLVAAIAERAEKLQFNAGDIRQGHLPPFIFDQQPAKVAAQLKDALDKGAIMHCGGMPEKIDGGYWQRPTLLTGVSNDMLMMKEETFGPLIPVTPFDTDDEAVTLANDSEFGLSGSVFGEEQHALAVAHRLEVGAVGINDASMTALIHDVEKQSFKYSGMGPSRMGDAGLLRFLRTRAIMIQRDKPAGMAVFDESLMP